MPTSHDLDFQQALGGAYASGDILDGKYRLDEVIGIGGMGVVVEALHLELQGRVAIKFLLPSRGDSDLARARLRREARACFRLTSEHVARVLDLVRLADGSQYMVMEHLKGSDFALLLAQHGRFRPDTTVGDLLQICEAVAEAHALGIVHRDLKPDNIFLCRRADGSPCVKVLDFGLAKVAAHEPALTRINRGLGTPHYMSPEQWISAAEAGASSDIWALGVLMFELIAGVPPFDAPDVTELSQLVLFDKPPSLSSIASDVPPGLEAVVRRCLQKKPAARFADVGELAAALLPFAPGAGPLAPKQKPIATEELPAARSSWGLALSQADRSSSAERPHDTIVDPPPVLAGERTVTHDAPLAASAPSPSRTPRHYALAAALTVLLALSLWLARPTPVALRTGLPTIAPTVVASTPAASAATTAPAPSASVIELDVELRGNPEATRKRAAPARARRGRPAPKPDSDYIPAEP